METTLMEIFVIAVWSHGHNFNIWISNGEEKCLDKFVLAWCWLIFKLLLQKNEDDV